MIPAERRSYDSHVHLQAYPSGMLRKVLRRARAAGVVRFGCCATAPDEWRRVLEISKAEDGVEPSFGVHPWFVEKHSDLAFMDELEELLVECPDAGVGEIGLDAVRPDSDAQKAVFAAQVELAARLKRRVTIHCVRAETAVAGILKPHARALPGILLHAPSISLESWRRFERLGVDVSVGPRVLNPRSRQVRELAAAVPADRLYFETDSPYTSVDKCAVSALNGLNAPETLPLVIAEVERLRAAESTKTTTGDAI